MKSGTGVGQPFRAAGCGGFPAANSEGTGGWKASPTGRQECLPYKRHERRGPFSGHGVVLALAALLVGAVLAQVSSPSGVVKGAFVFPEYDKANPMRLRSLLTGVGAKPLANGQVWFNQLRLETYAEEGKTNFVVIGTNCVFDPQNRLASSPDRLEVHGGDGRFFIEGVGFLWRQSDWHLTISNRVHVRLCGVEAAAAQKQP